MALRKFLHPVAPVGYLSWIIPKYVARRGALNMLTDLKTVKLLLATCSYSSYS